MELVKLSGSKSGKLNWVICDMFDGLTFPNWPKYALTSSIVVLALNPPTKIFFVRVIIYNTQKLQKLNKKYYFFFLKNVCRTQVLFVGPLIPLFWTSSDVFPGFSKPGWIPLLACFLACIQQIPQIHLWCDTCFFNKNIT